MYAFLTRHPYFELFYQTINAIHREIVEESDKSCKDQRETIANPGVAKILEALYSEEPGGEKGQIVVSGIVPPYIVPKAEDEARNAVGFFCPTLFAALPRPALCELLCSILLERSVIFQSSSLNLLTSAMYRSPLSNRLRVDSDVARCCIRSDGSTC